MPLHYIETIALGTFLALAAVWILGLAWAAFREIFRGEDDHE